MKTRFAICTFCFVYFLGFTTYAVLAMIVWFALTSYTTLVLWAEKICELPDEPWQHVDDDWEPPEEDWKC